MVDIMHIINLYKANPLSIHKCQ